MVSMMCSLLPTVYQILTYLPWFKKINPSEVLKASDEYATQSIERHKSLYNKESETPRTLFSKIYQASNDDTLTLKEMRDNAQSYIVGGSDTTSSTLTYLVWAVCRHPGVQKRLVEEVKGLPGDFCFEHVRKLPYLNQVLQETLRLYGAVPAHLPREVPAGGVKLSGYWLPGGVDVGAQLYTLHQDPAVFHDPLKFDPSRWENPTQAMQNSFMPFGGGSRSKSCVTESLREGAELPFLIWTCLACIGLHLAYLEMRMAIALFFRAFPNATVSNLEGMNDEDMRPLVYFLMSPMGQRCLIQKEIG